MENLQGSPGSASQCPGAVGLEERSRGHQGHELARLHTRAKTLALPAGSQNLGTKGFGPGEHLCEGFSALGWEPQREITQMTSGTTKCDQP